MGPKRPMTTGIRPENRARSETPTPSNRRASIKSWIFRGSLASVNQRRLKSCQRLIGSGLGISMRVLLIEDDKAISLSIELMLRSEGFNVYTTDLGEEGAELGKLYDYDIILLDLNLPDIIGHDVLKNLRVSKISTPVLVLSGLAGIDHKVRSLGFGADDYLTKPFHKDELVARIHAIVRRSKGHAQSVIETGDLKVNLDDKTE